MAVGSSYLMLIEYGSSRRSKLGQSAWVQLRQANVRIGFSSAVDWGTKMLDVR